jgi:hypothetical protein
MDLGHHGPHVSAFGQKVTMPTVVAGDPVGVAQVLAHTDPYGFLSAVKVHAGNQLARLEVRAQALFNTSNEQHSLIHGQAIGGTGTAVSGFLFHGFNLGVAGAWLMYGSLTHGCFDCNQCIS